MDIQKAKKLKKIILSSFGLILVTVSVFVGVILVQRRVRYETPAIEKVADIYIEPSTQSLPPDSSFRLMLNPGGQEVVFAQVIVKYDSNKLELIDGKVNTSPYMSDVITKEVVNETFFGSTKLVKIVLAVPVSDTPPSNTFEFANFSFKALSTTSNDQVSLELVPSDIQIVGSDKTEFSLNTTNSVLTLNPTTSTPTPTPTGVLPTLTPKIGVTNTPTPTLKPTSTPTPTPTSSVQTCSSIGGTCRRFCYFTETKAGTYDCSGWTPNCCIPGGSSTF